jgi:hypothetical protein
MTNLQNGAIYQGYCLINQMLKADLRRESDRRENSNDYSCNNDQEMSFSFLYLQAFLLDFLIVCTDTIPLPITK